MISAVKEEKEGRVRIFLKAVVENALAQGKVNIPVTNKQRNDHIVLEDHQVGRMFHQALFRLAKPHKLIQTTILTINSYWFVVTIGKK